MRRFLRMGAAVATLCCGGGAWAQTDPQPVDPETWVVPDDYPTDALVLKEQGITRVEMQVGRTGKPTGCRTVESSSSALLDATTCRLMLERSSFRPATNVKGVATAGRWRMSFTWQLPGSTPSLLIDK